MPLLLAKNLKKYFPIHSGILRKVSGYVKAVDGVDFSIGHGETLALVGESGSGKSTTGRMAIRLIEPTSGTLEFDGDDLLALSKNELKEKRRKMQIVFQDPFASLNPRKTILESIGRPLVLHEICKTHEEMEEMCAEILQKVGLSKDLLYRYPHEFSGGQQQRICIGRAIGLNPKLLVLDEAVSALDVSVQAQILNLLMELKERLHLSYLFISHDLGVVRHIADQVMVMHQGKIVESGETAAIFSDPVHPYTKKLLSSRLCSKFHSLL